MEHYPSWEVNSHSASQDSTTGPYPELDELSTQFPIPICMIHSNIILLSMSRSSKWPLPFRFLGQNFVCWCWGFLGCDSEDPTAWEWSEWCSEKGFIFEGVFKSFQSSCLGWELQMIQLSATRRSCIAILWVSLVSFATITLCVASQEVFVVVVVVYFIINSVQKLMDTP
jgi:hypothetical protein